MKTEALFRRFNDLADEPERIPMLRKVILSYLLHTAVNAPDADTRAQYLRASHAARRENKIKNTRRKDVLNSPTIVDGDLPPCISHIPVGIFDRLGNIASIEKGVSQIQRTKPGKYPLVVTAESRSSSESFDFEGPAAIVPMVSSTGHGDASLKRLHYQEGQYAVGNILSVVQPFLPDLIHARFLFEYLSAFKDELLVSRMVGTANVSLTVNKLKEVPVPLVSGPVLDRISELMALCDQLEALQQEREMRHTALASASLARFADAPTPANLQFLIHKSYDITPADLRKTILTLAVQGRLVPQNPTDEPAEDFLGSVYKLKKEGILEGAIRHQKTLPPIDKTETTIEFPSSWALERLGNLALRIGSGSTPRGGKNAYVSTGVPFLRSQNIWNDGIRLTDAVFISKETHEKMANTTVYPNDILLNITGASLGRSAIAPPDFPEANVSQHVTIIRAVIPESRWFIHLFLISPYGQEYIWTRQVGMAREGLSKKVLECFEIPVPPLAEQRRIVAKVNELMGLVDQLEIQQADSRAVAEKLMEAFVGELTITA